MDTTQTNCSQLNTLQVLPTLPRRPLKDTSKSTRYRTSSTKAGTGGNIKSGLEEKIGGNSSIQKDTITLHPLPISNQRLKDFIAIQSQKSMEEVIRDEFLPSVFQIREVRDSVNSPPQCRLQASQVFINKIVGDKIDIKQTKIAVDVNKLLDQLSSIRALTPNIPNDVIELEDKDT